MARRAAIFKRVSLEGLAEGWGSDCFALVAPANFQEYQEFLSLDRDSMTNTEAVAYQYKFVKDRLASGKIMVFDTETGETKLDDLQKDDIDTSQDLCDKLFMEICGIKFDPKDLEAAAEPESKPTPSENSTGTTSSTVTPETSRQK